MTGVPKDILSPDSLANNWGFQFMVWHAKLRISMQVAPFTLQQTLSTCLLWSLPL